MRAKRSFLFGLMVVKIVKRDVEAKQTRDGIRLCSKADMGAKEEYISLQM